MGGYSKWKILEDKEITQFKEYFAPPPAVVSGVLEEEAKKVFNQTPLWMFGSEVSKPKL